MKVRYYLSRNEQRGGVHEVHRGDCFFLPIEKNRISLGIFSDSVEAVEKGKEFLSNVGRCRECLGGSVIVSKSLSPLKKKARSERVRFISDKNEESKRV